MIPSQDCLDLASELLGSAPVAASDEFFAPKENLVKVVAPVFLPDKFTEAGKWMDGWETRRRRTPGNDWCVVRLGLPGILRGVDVDTSFFIGNSPSHCSVETCSATDGNWAQAQWTLALPRVRLQGGAHNLFDVENGERCTHVRLNIFPDGGVARFRAYGEVVPDLAALAQSPDPVDLASVVNGGVVLACSDMHFGSKHNLVMPGRPANMGGGWETRRRRGPGFDWIIVRLGARSAIDHVAVETEHFKGNFPGQCSLDACNAAPNSSDDLVTGKVAWQEILAPTKLTPDAVHTFKAELQNHGPYSHVRLNIYPDGGISRLRVFGRIV